MKKHVYQFGGKWRTIHGLSFGRAKRILRNKGFRLEEYEKECRSWWFEGVGNKGSARLFWDQNDGKYTIHYFK